MVRDNTITRLGLVAASAVILAVSGCRKDEPEPAPAPAEPVATNAVPLVQDRMNDPAYVKKLDNQLTKRQEILRGISAAKAALTKAEEAGAGAEEIAQRKADLEAAYQKLDALNRQSEQIIRNRMQQQINK